MEISGILDTTINLCSRIDNEISKILDKRMKQKKAWALLNILYDFNEYVIV